MQKLLLIALLISSLSNKGCSAQEIGNKVDNILSNYTDSGFSGTALVVINDKVVLNKAYGLANREKHIPNTVNHLFNVASIGKQFTAVTVLKLEEKGLLNTKDHVTKYVGKLGGLKDNATIEHLLMHNSGLFVAGAPLNYNSRDSFIASVRSTPLESKPGEKHRYSNAGYTLMAAIVEIVTKEPFENVFYKMIFEPAGMKNTGYPWEDRIEKNLLATGYNRKGEWQPAEENVWGARGSGNQVTNNDDMLKWYRAAWQKDNLVTKQMKERILKDHIPGKETFAWNKSIAPNGKTWFYKGGGRPDFESQLMWWPEEDLFIFFVINNDTDLRRRIFREMTTLINKAVK